MEQGKEAEFKRPAVTFENEGVLYVYLEDETKLKKIDLNPQIVTIAAGETSGSFNIIWY